MSTDRVDRRTALAFAAAVPLVSRLASPAFGEARPESDPEWPRWTQAPLALYARLDAARRGAADLRRFGATLNGSDDDTAAFEKAIAAGVRILFVPPALDPARPIRLTREIRTAAPIVIIGAGDRSVIRWEGAEEEAFLVSPDGDDPVRFLADVHIDSLRMIRSGTLPRGHMVQAVNVRGFSLTRCSTQWMRGAVAMGGVIQFMRRVRDVYIAHNQVGGCNGGIYGNNGDGIVAAYNDVAMTTDVGIDFAGCFNAVAHHNHIRNAGNFCYVAFYAARNIRFHDNVGVQDGGGTGISKLYGRGQYGTERGPSPFAMRCSGFANIVAAVVVDVVDNDFSWTGRAGLGDVMPSYRSRLYVQRNWSTNVVCDFTYPHMANVSITDRLAFDRAAPAPSTSSPAPRRRCGSRTTSPSPAAPSLPAAPRRLRACAASRSRSRAIA